MFLIKGEKMRIKKICLIVSIFFTAVSFLLCGHVVNTVAQEKALGKDTLSNLQEAYNRATNAKTMYLAFADIAGREGYDVPGNLFKAAAFAKEMQAQHYGEFIIKLGRRPETSTETPVVKGTKENLEAALMSENYEHKIMYPAFMQQAESENIKEAADVFRNTAKAAGMHVQWYSKMLDNLTFSRGLTKDFYVCPTCGNIIDAITMSRCPICATETKKFIKPAR